LYHRAADILKNLQANLVEGVWIITGYKLMITIL